MRCCTQRPHPAYNSTPSAFQLPSSHTMAASLRLRFPQLAGPRPSSGELPHREDVGVCSTRCRSPSSTALPLKWPRREPQHLLWSYGGSTAATVKPGSWAIVPALLGTAPAPHALVAPWWPSPLSSPFSRLRLPAHWSRGASSPECATVTPTPLRGRQPNMPARKAEAGSLPPGLLGLLSSLPALPCSCPRARSCGPPRRLRAGGEPYSAHRLTCVSRIQPSAYAQLSASASGTMARHPAAIGSSFARAGRPLAQAMESARTCAVRRIGDSSHGWCLSWKRSAQLLAFAGSLLGVQAPARTW